MTVGFIANLPTRSACQQAVRAATSRMYQVLGAQGLNLLIMGWYFWGGVLTSEMAVLTVILVGAIGSGLMLFLASEYYRQAQYWRAVLAFGPLVDDRAVRSADR